jgi:hypothetical protein
LLAIASAASAHATLFDRAHFTFADSVQEDLCGIDARIDTDLRGSVVLRYVNDGRDQAFVGHSTTIGSDTFTNLANGESFGIEFQDSRRGPDGPARPTPPSMRRRRARLELRSLLHRAVRAPTLRVTRGTRRDAFRADGRERLLQQIFLSVVSHRARQGDDRAALSSGDADLGLLTTLLAEAARAADQTAGASGRSAQ